MLLKACQNRAVESNTVCTITFEEILEKLVECDGFCVVTGEPFNLSSTGDIATSNPYMPSLDQIVPGKGYTKENVQVVVWWFNAAKGNYEIVM